MFLDLLKVPRIYVPLHIALTLVFWTFTLKKSPLFLDFVLDFILLEACIRNLVLVCGLVDFWRSRHLLYAENPIQTYAYARELTTCIPLLHYAISPESFTKTLQFHLQIRPFYAEQLLSSCDFTEYYSITLSLAILANLVL